MIVIFEKYKEIIDRKEKLRNGIYLWDKDKAKCYCCTKDYAETNDSVAGLKGVCSTQGI